MSTTRRIPTHRPAPVMASAPARATFDPQRAREIAAIHAAAHALGMDTADKSHSSDYRTMLRVQGGKPSAADLSAQGRRKVLAYLAKLQGKRPSMTQQEFIAELWRRLGDAGALTDRSLLGLDAWIKGQVGVDSLRFIDTANGNRLVEALKDWLARATAKAGRQGVGQ